MPTATVWLEHGGADTVVHVVGFGRLAGAVQVDSCNHCTDLPDCDWERRTRDAVDARLASDGMDKGRVLFASWVQFPSPRLIPVGAAVLHLDDHVVRVLHVGHVKRTLAPLQQQSARLLLSCCSIIAAEHGCDRFEMLLHSETEVRKYCKEAYGLRRVGRRGSRYDGLRHNDFLVERMVRP